MPLLVLAALLPHFAYPAGAVANATGQSLARFVPRDSNLYVEIRDLRGLMRFRSFAALDRLLRMPHAFAPAPDRRLAPWLGRIKAIADIDRDELLRSYFGDEVAVAAPSWERLADGVVLARVRDANRIERLFARAHGPVLAPGGGRRVCTLGPQEGLWLAARGNTIVLGPSPSPGSYFFRVAELLTGRDDQPTLEDEPQFVEVRRSLPPRVRGWLFIRRGDDPPAAGTPTDGPREAKVDRLMGTFLDRAAYLGAAFEVGDEELRVTAAGHAARAPPFLADAFSAGLAACPIPEATLLSWRFGYDYASACRSLSVSSRGGTVRFLVGLAESAAPGASLADDILEKVGPDSALVVGYAEGASVDMPFDLPLVSFIVRVEPPERVVLDTADALARKLATIANFQLLRAGRDDLIRVTQRRHNGVAYSSLPIGRFLATQSDCEFLASLDLSWCVHQGWLILSSHPAHLKQIVDAGIARRRPPAAARPTETPPPNELIVVRPRATAALIDRWLKYLRASHPHMLEDGWWQLVRQRRSGARVQLGLGLKTDPAQPGKVLVALTLEGWPAYDSISKGDFILGVDGRLLSTEDPLAEFKRLLRERKYLDHVLLRVEHEGKARDVRVEIPPSPDLEPSAKNPVQLLAPLARLCQDFTLATYRLSFGQPGGFFAELVLRFDPARRPDTVTRPVTIAPHK